MCRGLWVRLTRPMGRVMLAWIDPLCQCLQSCLLLLATQQQKTTWMQTCRTNISTAAVAAAAERRVEGQGEGTAANGSRNSSSRGKGRQGSSSSSSWGLMWQQWQQQQPAQLSNRDKDPVAEVARARM